ncbi:MauE/DoxX family redox-associated membrane protein [Dictyobacter arantiisoli]|uniref:MauE/DoxX family redox-associated membrane protein n=1 Tax=Dictyobacter arantiisoli TaxID=2014874 RepID=UPI0011ED242E|nr:MauE/DoxX family redox-associated membrane protein [Dictyobacter arantiisoli]
MISYIVALCQVVLAATLLLAANGKLFRSDQFIDALRLSRLPDTLVSLFSVSIPTVEFFLAIALLLSPFSVLSITFGASCILLIIFTFWMVFVSMRNMHIKCGCFGTASDTVGLRSIVRNAILLGCGLLGLALSLKVSSALPEPSLEMAIIVVSLELCLALFQSFHSARSFLLLSKKDMSAVEDNFLSQTN